MEGPNEPRIFLLVGSALELVDTDPDTDIPLESRLTELRRQFPDRRYFVIDELVRP